VNDLRANAVHLTDKLTLTPALSPITGRGGQRSKTLIVYRENAPAGDGCPLQKENLCSVHAIRPFGCRIFFCDTTATQWQQERYELFHAELKQLHERFDVPYFYVEWRSALAAIGVSG
jgi:Fe-S-cluster containining protein